MVGTQLSPIVYIATIWKYSGAKCSSTMGKWPEEAHRRGRRYALITEVGLISPRECLGTVRLPLPPQVSKQSHCYIDLIRYVNDSSFQGHRVNPAQALPFSTPGPSLLLPRAHEMGRIPPLLTAYTTKGVDGLRELDFPWFVVSGE